MRRAESGPTDVRTRLAGVHDALQKGVRTTAEVRAVRRVGGSSERHAVRARPIRRQQDRTVPWELGVRRRRKHHQHGGAYTDRERRVNAEPFVGQLRLFRAAALSL